MAHWRSNTYLIASTIRDLPDEGGPISALARGENSIRLPSYWPPSNLMDFIQNLGFRRWVLLV